MIEIQNVSKRYGDKYAVKDATFTIKKGEILGFLGRNGAGKSTLLKCIDRILHPQDGIVLVDGKDVFSMRGNEMAQNIAYVAQNARSVNMTDGVFQSVR